MFGYAGKILHINLSKKKVRRLSTDKMFAKGLVCGRHTGAKILYDKLKPKTDPLNPENLIIIATGPLTGTLAPASSSYSIVTKSPLTNGFLNYSMLGSFGSELKYAGFDAFILEGKMDMPVYILIVDQTVELKDAKDVMGKDVYETEEIIMKDTGERRLKSLSIGPAGEHLVRYASVVDDLHRSISRGGSGAVLGSKNVKAIVVRGTGAINLAKPERLESIVKDFQNMVTSDNWLKRMAQGTLWLIDIANQTGIQPTNNFQIENLETHINSNAVRSLLRIKNISCLACPLACQKYSDVLKGTYKVLALMGPEYDCISMLGPNCGIVDLEAVTYASLLCDRYGLDAISTGNTIAFAMECFEKGVLAKEDTSELEPKFGNTEAMLQLINLITYRKGFGNLLAQGVRRISDKIGKGSKKWAMHVKGMELPGYDPRAVWAMGLAYATSITGACNLGPQILREEILSGEGFNRYSFTGRAELIVALENEEAILDSMGICNRTGLPSAATEWFSAVTGLEANLLHSDKGSIVSDLVLNLNGQAVEVGAQTLTISRSFNLREGFSMENDKLPERFFKETNRKVTDKRPLDSHSFEKALGNYYNLRGWNEKGVPEKNRE